MEYQYHSAWLVETEAVISDKGVKVFAAQVSVQALRGADQ